MQVDLEIVQNREDKQRNDHNSVVEEHGEVAILVTEKSGGEKQVQIDPRGSFAISKGE